jgi:hypothetical protein
MAEWLLNNNARPTFAVSVESSRAEMLNDFRVLARWRGQVENTIPAGASLLV